MSNLLSNMSRLLSSSDAHWRPHAKIEGLVSVRMQHDGSLWRSRCLQRSSRSSVISNISQLDRLSGTVDPALSKSNSSSARGSTGRMLLTEKDNGLSTSTSETRTAHYRSNVGDRSTNGSDNTMSGAGRPSINHQAHDHDVKARSLSSRPGRNAAFAATLERPTVQATISYEMVKGNLVRFSSTGSNGSSSRQPPTVVLVHGILGSRRNMQSFARRLVEGFPSWQVLLVDLRCHGESASEFASEGPHTVDSAAGDVLKLLSSLKLFPEMLIGHSFGGKVVMSMAHQFGESTRRLPRPVQVWVLDALPGEVRSGEMGQTDRPADLISTLLTMPLPIRDRPSLISYLERAGFSPAVAAWTASSLTPVSPTDRSQGFVWSFDLQGIAEMYRSYESTSLWRFLERPAEGIRLDFVKAERSTFRWGGIDESRIESLGHKVHLLHNSGHWVHTDNPDGLFDILASSFGMEADIHMQRSPQGSPSVSRKSSLN